MKFRGYGIVRSMLVAASMLASLPALGADIRVEYDRQWPAAAFAAGEIRDAAGKYRGTTALPEVRIQFASQPGAPRTPGADDFAQGQGYTISRQGNVITV